MLATWGEACSIAIYAFFCGNDSATKERKDRKKAVCRLATEGHGFSRMNRTQAYIFPLADGRAVHYF